VSVANERKTDIYLVKDEGIYLMVFGDKNIVEYARGCNPKTTSDTDYMWDHCRDIAGGDDFGEIIAPVDHFQDLLNRGAKSVSIYISPTEFRIEANVLKNTKAPQLQAHVS
jgi:hypothetical protein